jgi:hypothetical protein
LARKLRHDWDGGVAGRAIYFTTVGLRDLHPELEEFAMDPGRAPQRILVRHLPDQSRRI